MIKGLKTLSDLTEHDLIERIMHIGPVQPEREPSGTAPATHIPARILRCAPVRCQGFRCSGLEAAGSRNGWATVDFFMLIGDLFIPVYASLC